MLVVTSAGRLQELSQEERRLYFSTLLLSKMQLYNLQF